MKESRARTTASSVLPGEERRRSQRVVIRVPVTLDLQIDGKKTTMKAATVSVNDHGAMLACVRNLPADFTFDLTNDLTREQMKCRVTRAAVANAQGYLIPVEFAQPSPGFWRISFPPADWKPLDD